MEQQRSSEIHEEELSAGEVFRDPHASTKVLGDWRMPGKQGPWGDMLRNTVPADDLLRQALAAAVAALSGVARWCSGTCVLRLFAGKKSTLIAGCLAHEAIELKLEWFNWDSR